MVAPSATVVTASLVSSGNNSAIQLSNISRPAATRSGSNNGGTNSTQSTGQLPINNGHSHSGVIATSGSGDLQSQRRSVSSGSTPFNSIEEYEAMIKEELCSGTPELRLFFERDPSLKTADYKGNTRRYAAPIELGEGNSTIIDISGSAPEGNLNYAIFCFLFDENSRNIKRIHVEGVLPLDIPSVIAPGKKFLRVLLRVQLLTRIFRIRKERSNATVPTPARLCYVELIQKDFDKTAYDCILPWTPLPRKIINVWKPENDNTPSLQNPARILKYAVSASGNYVATLAANKKHLYLDLWRVDIQSSIQRAVYPSSELSTPLAQAILNIETPEYRHVEVSISWNGSQIAIYKNPEGSASRIQLFEQPQGQNNQNPTLPLVLNPSTQHAQCTELKTFRGYTNFTQLATSTWSDASERFIIFDGMDVILYSTEGQWQRLYPIQIYSGLDTKSFQRTVLTVAGGFFASLESPYQLSLWNLESGKVAQLIDTTHVIEEYLISSDGKSVSILSDSHLRMYSTETGGLVYASKLESKSEIAFLHGDTTLVVPKADGRWGLIQRLQSGTTTTTTSRQDLHCATRERPLIQDIKPGSGLHGFEYESTIVTQCHGSLLDISFIEDILTNSDESSESDCTSLCVTNLQELSEFREREEITFPGGTGVLWMDEGDDQHKFRLEVSVDFEDGMSKQFRIKADRFYFVSSCHTIVAISQSSGNLVAIWKLPASSDTDFELLLHWFLDFSAQDVVMKTCPHNGMMTVSLGGFNIQLALDRVCSSENAQYFFGSMKRLLADYSDPWLDHSDAIARYLRSRVNTYACPKDHIQSVFSAICKLWDPTVHDTHEKLVRQLLALEDNHRWAPPASYSSGANPVEIILEIARTKPGALSIATAFIEYSIDRAKDERDISHLLYLCGCMDHLVMVHPDLALRITRAFVYLRCKDRKSIIDHYRIAQPPAFRNLFSAKDPRLYECRNPIMQLHYPAQEKEPMDGRFSENFFVAPFQLLWTFAPHPHKACAEYSRIERKATTNWFEVLYHLIIYLLNPASHVYVIPRYYNVEALDNPAIEALIQFKWNSFAYLLWLTRFMAQCTYYLLILTTAVMQVLLRQSEFLLGLFVAIAALSCLFLWLEVLQWLESRQYLRSKKDPQDANTSSPYFRSSYNYLDIIVYLFPLVASVHQLLNTVLDVQNAVTWDFSFCAVLVPIHLVAELRVSEIACKYVVVISGLLARVRFFFINFVAAILVFSLVILHALYSYKANINDDEEQSFPSSLYDAISVIYLALSGRYDPTAEGSLSTKQDDDKTPYRNMPLQIIVMIFFFMISILIATINESFFGENDKWRRHRLDNRLRYVESAENLSYHIPGLRRIRPWFPSRIYYAATTSQVRHYWERTKDLDEQISTVHDMDESRPRQDIASSSKIFSMMDGIEKQIDYTHRQGSSDTRSNFEKLHHTLDERLKQQDRKFMKLLEQQRLEYKRDIIELRQEITQQNTWVYNRFDETWQALREQGSDIAELKLTVAKTQEGVEEVTRCVYVLMDTIQLALKEDRSPVRSEKNEKKILDLAEHKEE